MKAEGKQINAPSCHPEMDTPVFVSRRVVEASGVDPTASSQWPLPPRDAGAGRPRLPARMRGTSAAAWLTQTDPLGRGVCSAFPTRGAPQRPRP